MRPGPFAVLLLLLALVALPSAACNSSRSACEAPSCTCPGGEACTFEGCDDACQLSCQANSDCLADLGTASEVRCEAATCAITVGDGSTVDCGLGSVCNIACTGSCTVDCSGAVDCFLSCGGERPAPLADQGECP